MYDSKTIGNLFEPVPTSTGFMIIGRDWRIIRFDGTALDRLNRSPEELNGMIFWEAYQHSVDATLESALRLTMEKREARQLTWYSQVTQRWFSFAIHPDGLGLTFSWQDITESRKIEQLLRSSEEMLRIVLNNSRDAINMYDLSTGQYVFMSPVQTQLTGYTAEDVNRLSSTEALQLVHPDDRAEAGDHFQRILAGLEDTSEVEYRLLTKSGEYRWISDRRTLVRDQNGQPVAFVGVNRDITRQKQIEEQIRTSEARFRVLINALAQAWWECDADGIVRTDSPSWRAYTGQTEAQYLGDGWSDAVHPDDRSRVMMAWKMAVQKGAQTDNEYRLWGPQGTWIWSNGFATPLRGSDGEIIRWIGLNIDISRRKLVEEKLRQANENKNVFLSTLSHELRNPLASIMMGISLLKQLPMSGESSKKSQEITGLMERQTGQLSRLVDDLLDVTRIARQRIVLKKEKVILNHLLQQAISDYQAVFAKYSVSLQMILTDQPIELEADPVRLTQVICNLLHNAVKFTDPGGTTVVTLTREASPAQAVIRIRDNGLGIAPAVQAELFEPFMQADQSLDRSGGGLGLGLVIAKGIVTMHGGTVEAASAGLGQGSEFTVRLPIQPTTGKQASMYASPVREASRDLRILLIEDNPDLSDILCEMLQLLGHKTASAASGLTGMAQAREFRPDVIICDIGLPGMNGYEVAARIRQDPELRHIFLIAFSGYAQPEDLERSRAGGFNRHLAKPVDAQTLMKILAEVPRII